MVRCYATGELVLGGIKGSEEAATFKAMSGHLAAVGSSSNGGVKKRRKKSAAYSSGGGGLLVTCVSIRIRMMRKRTCMKTGLGWEGGSDL